jgi:hypothetical protein
LEYAKSINELEENIDNLKNKLSKYTINDTNLCCNIPDFSLCILNNYSVKKIFNYFQNIDNILNLFDINFKNIWLHQILFGYILKIANINIYDTRDSYMNIFFHSGSNKISLCNSENIDEFLYDNNPIKRLKNPLFIPLDILYPNNYNNILNIMIQYLIDGTEFTNQYNKLQTIKKTLGYENVKKISGCENIVFLADEYHYKKWTLKSYYDLLTYIRDHNTKYKVHVFWSDDTAQNVYVKILELNPKFIFIFDTDTIQGHMLKFDFIFYMNIPKILCSLDMFYPSRFYFDPNIKYLDGLLHFSKNDAIVKSYSRLFPNKYIGSIDSRFINVNKFKDYKLEKKYDILLYGTRNYYYNYKTEPLDSIQNWIKKYESNTNTLITNSDKINFYYLRSKLENILLKNSNKYNLKFLPEKLIYGPMIANEELSQLINESHITIACSTIADIMMHKYLEIGASKSVILGNIPTDYKNLFENNILEVNEYMTEEEILKIIDDGLANKNKLEEMSNNLYNKIHQEHNFDCAINNFNELFDNLSF